MADVLKDVLCHVLYFIDVCGSMIGVVSSRRQVPFIIMEDECNRLAQEKCHAMESLVTHHTNLGIALHRQIEDMNIDDQELHASAMIGAELSVNGLLDKMEAREEERLQEHDHPGTLQKLLFSSESYPYVWQRVSTEDPTVERDIIVSGDRLVFDRDNVKTCYREGKSRWHGQVGVTVYEGLCSMGEEGVGRRYRFVVNEPTTHQIYEGHIKHTRQLKDILGTHAMDLMQKKKTTELLLFVIKYRMEMVRQPKLQGGPKPAAQNPGEEGDAEDRDAEAVNAVTLPTRYVVGFQDAPSDTPTGTCVYDDCLAPVYTYYEGVCLLFS